MFDLRRSVRGFTLIEMMIALVIVAAALAFVMPSAVDWIRNVRIRAAAEELMNELTRARVEAIKRNRQVGFQVVDNLSAACALSLSGRSWVISQFTAVGLCNTALITPATPADLTVTGFATAQADPLIIARGTAPADAQVGFNVYSIAGVNTAGPLVFNSFGQLVTPATLANVPVNIDVRDATPADCRPIPPAAGTGTLRCMRITINSGGQIRMCDPSEQTVGDTRAC